MPERRNDSRGEASTDAKPRAFCSFVDAHVQISQPDGVSASFAPFDYSAHIAALERITGRGCGIVIAGRACADIGICREFNDRAAALARDSGGRVSWLAAVPPLARETEGELVRCAELGAIGAGAFDPTASVWDITDARETWRLAAACHELGLFALIRASFGGTGGATAADIFALARNHPELRIQASALGGGLFAREAEPEAAHILQNVSYDTAHLPAGAAAPLAAAALAIAQRKVLFATGGPAVGIEELREVAALFAR